MAASVGSLEVSLGADIARLRKDLGRATAIAEKRARAMQNTFKKAAGVIGASFAGLSFGALIKNVADVGDRFQKLSISLGVSTEALSQYRLVAERSGTTMESLALIWQRQTRRVAEAAQGTGEARNALRELGLQADDLAKLAPDKQFEAIAEAMKGVENQSDKLRIAFKLFDSEGARPALQIMAEGAAGIREMRHEADAMGLTMTRVQADQMAKFNDSLTDSKLAITGASQQLILSLAPNIIAVAKGFAEGVKWVSKFTDGLRNIDNQTNIESLREKMVVLSEEAVRLQKRIELTSAAGGDTTEMKKRLDRAVEMYQQALARIKELNKQAEEIGGANEVADIFSGLGKGSPEGLPSIEDDKAAEREAAAQERMKEALAAKVEALRESLMTEEQLIIASYGKRQELLMEALDNRLVTEEEFDQLRLEAAEQYEQKLTAMRQAEAQNRLKIESDITKNEIALKEQVTKQGIGFLKMLGSKKKAFAVAAIAIETAMNIKQLLLQQKLMTAQTVASTAAAMMMARATLPPPAGDAMAAKYAADGAASVAAIQAATAGGIALTAAAGAVQLASAFGGGPGGGGSSNVSIVDPVTGLPSENPENQRQRQPVTYVTINLGDDELLDSNGVRNLIEKLNEATDDGAVIGGITVS